jgi:transcriptional regulator with XRE-family HTH domain
MADDMALRGWHAAELADRADVARSTVGRFLAGESQTAKTAKKLADVLGYSVRRYISALPTKSRDRRTDDRRDGARRAADR